MNDITEVISSKDSESILNSIKKMLGPTSDDTHFDADLIIHINSVFAILSQMGVGPKDGFSIQDDSTLWSSYIDGPEMQMVKSYMYLKVRLIFDPPTNSSVMDSTNKLIDEYEWRLHVGGDK